MDTKRNLFILFSRGWDASSPVCYTLQRIHKYCHFGYTKNMSRLPECELFCKKILDGTWENFDTNNAHMMNHTIDMEPLRDFPLEHIKNYFSYKNDSQYIDFYLALYDHVKTKGYKAVGTIAGTFSLLKRQDCYTRITQSFNTKSVVLFRDPVRRAISCCIRDPERTPNLDMDDLFFDYVDFWKKASNLFPDSIYFTMEDLYEDGGKTIKILSEYLNHPIDELWPNLYSPDIGHHLQWNLDLYHCPTPCQTPGQFNLNIKPKPFPITTEYYYTLKDKYQSVYDNWINYFGHLPTGWGQPVDYDKNLENYPYYSPKYKYPIF